jgi:flagellar protein FliS
MVAQDFAKIYRTNSVLTATPGQLVLMLFDSALRSMAVAREAFGRPATDLTRFEIINKHLTKARRIIAELRGTLNFEAGGDFAALMDRLYDYYNRRLFEANLRKDPAPIVEVEGLLSQLREAWSEMLQKEGRPASAPAAHSLS